MATGNLIRGMTARQIFMSLATTLVVNLRKGQKLQIGKKTYDAATLQKLFGAPEKLYVTADTLKQRWINAVKARDKEEDDLFELAQAVVAALDVLTGGDPEELSKFKLPPIKARRELTVQEKVARADKARRTRQLRLTRGKRQLAGIKAQGTVTVSTALEATPSSAPRTQPTDAEPSSTRNVIVPPADGSGLNGALNGAAH